MNNGKLSQRPAKRHVTAFYIVGIFAFAIEFMLGLNVAFLVDQSVAIVAANMLEGTPLAGLAAIIALIAALAVGVMFVLGGMWTFAGFMDTLEDARAFTEEYAAWLHWPEALAVILEVAIIALDFATLLFRSAYFASKGADALIGFFIILILLPPILGPLLHVLENTPRDRRIAKSHRRAERYEVGDLEYAVESMPPDLRTRMLNGDENAIPDYYALVAQEERMAEEAAAQAEEQRQAKEVEKKERRQRRSRPLAVAALSKRRGKAIQE